MILTADNHCITVSGVVKCLSLLATKKLDRRLKSRKRQYHQRSSATASDARKLVAKANFNTTVASVASSRAASSDFTRRTRFFYRRHTSISEQNSVANGIGILKLDATQKRLTRNLAKAKLQLRSSKALTTAKSIVQEEIFPDQNGISHIDEPSSVLTKIDSVPSVVELSPFVVDPRHAYQNSPLSAPSPCSSTTNVNFHIPPVLTNPMEWSHEHLFCWLSNSDLSTNLALRLKEEVKFEQINFYSPDFNTVYSQLVDGQAFMLLTLPDVQRFLGLKLGPALKLCEIIKQLKVIYLNEFAN
uniref:SAM domain-containing protein n=1 Tax=Romanomermis culicivorax TaxID=13658 RepID=A0A915JAF4_ROMCU